MKTPPIVDNPLRSLVSYKCKSCEFRCLCPSNHGEIRCPVCSSETKGDWIRLEIFGVPDRWFHEKELADE